MRRKRVLIADDSESIRGLLVLLLQGWDVEVVTVTDGLQAGDRIAERAFDLVITDYQMPGIDGAELTRRIKRAQPSCTVIAVTGCGELGPLREAGADVCLPKPVDVARLTGLLTDLLSSGGRRA